MSYFIRLMRKEDITQVNEIDQEAFPAMWPPPNYERELRTPLAHYIVACNSSTEAGTTAATTRQERSATSLLERLQQLFGRSRTLSTREVPSAQKQHILGFAGLWLMADEAHITNIAVRQSYRLQGIGEHLLISLINLALELNSRILTLEVRASNTAAQRLYQKYGFRQVNRRRGYYTDNKEDALVMTIEDTTKATFQKRLNQLKKAYSRRWG